tara:strand:- start:95 stop:1360 length:1266 start_codon:yes stop_codon:yes gene_type:complete
LNVLLVGSGGREHALAWKINQSPKLDRLFIAPGNAGTQSLGTNLQISDTDIDGLLQFAKKNDVGLTIVGPEAPLASGIVDIFADAELPIFGPKAAAAKLESSKSFAKKVMEKWRIPTASHVSFNKPDQAIAYLDEITSFPTVIKADGLAAGKGVYICQNKAEAVSAITEIMVSKVFGNAGKTLVIEEFLDGWELSAFAFTDGNSISELVAACDYKRIGEDDTGPNTGGMGAFSPPPIWDQNMKDEIMDLVIKPVIDGMRTDHEPFMGTLFAGMMITNEGPKVVEFNCRLGDPETQVLLPLLDSDLLDIMESCVNGTLESSDVKWSSNSSVAIVLASGGYPNSYSTGHRIDGLSHLDEKTKIFHAGTTTNSKGEVVTNGGRVLSVNAVAKNMDLARSTAYAGAKRISFKDVYMRNDIANDVG